MSPFDAAFDPFSAFSPFYTDFFDFASPSLLFFVFVYFGGLSPAFYFDLLFDFLSLILFKNITNLYENIFKNVYSKFEGMIFI